VAPSAPQWCLRSPEQPAGSLHTTDKPVICALTARQSVMAWTWRLAATSGLLGTGPPGGVSRAAVSCLRVRHLAVCLGSSAGRRATELAFRGRMSTRRRRLSLAREWVVPPEQLAAEVRNWPRRIRPNAPLPCSAKRLMRLGLAESFEANVAPRFPGALASLPLEDFQEGVRSFTRSGRRRLGVVEPLSPNPWGAGGCHRPLLHW